MQVWPQWIWPGIVVIALLTALAVWFEGRPEQPGTSAAVMPPVSTLAG